MSGSLESSLSSDSIICSVLYPYFLSFLRTWIKHGFLLSSDDFNVYCGCDSLVMWLRVQILRSDVD